LTFSPALGIAFNLDEADRTSGFGDAEINFVFANGSFLGTGVTMWDFTRSQIFTLGWLGTAGYPIWRSDARKHALQFNVEWRQMFDRLSDPDVNYQFWGGLRYTFK
jgi:hypothetical protein